MSKINTRTRTKERQHMVSTLDNEGNVIKKTAYRDTEDWINGEPDYAKIYSECWKELAKSGISDSAKIIFVSMANKMEYANKYALRLAQTIKLDTEMRREIMEESGITNEKVFYRHLKSLVDLGFVRPALDETGAKRRSVYQINPKYASKGQWVNKSSYPVYGVCDLVQHWDNPIMYTMDKSEENKNGGR